MAWARGTPLLTMTMALALAVACTHDFAQYEPGSTTADAAADTGGKADSSTPDAPAPCTETGAVSYVGHCYFAVPGNYDFDGAKSICATKGAHLATITSVAERDVVRTLGNARERWIGLSRLPSAPGIDASYQWVTGEPRAGFADWSAGEPDATGECVRLHTGISDWGDDLCSNGHDAVCERD